MRMFKTRMAVYPGPVQPWTIPTGIYRRVVILVLLSLLVSACTSPDSRLERILEQGKLRIVTTYSPTSYMVEDESESGFEYELARMFAAPLKVQLEVVVAPNKAGMIEMLRQDKADIAVGLLKSTSTGDPELVAGPDYYSVTPQVIYHSGMDKPETPNDLYPFALHIPDGLVSNSVLEQTKQAHPEFGWNTHSDKSSIDLIELLHNEQIAYAATYSNELILAQQSYPELRSAFDLAPASPLIWLTLKSVDTSLQQEIDHFFNVINTNAYLAELIDYYYGPVRKFDYVDQRRFVELFHSRLPQYAHLFRQAAESYGFDWRLLAAMSYQESHWNERARSPTGVRGMMMLTRDTAKRMQVSNRLDPAQSIAGGARYIREMVDKVPERITEPDRIWFGLAAYNIGFGHLEDARIITQKRGGSADKWQDVKESLPLLANEQWYSQTTNGQARGGETVVFVENIRKYYNSLLQLTHEDVSTTGKTAPALPEQITRLQLKAL